MLESITAFAVLLWLVMNLVPLLLFMKKEEARLQHQVDYYRYLLEMTEEFNVTKKIEQRSIVVEEGTIFLRAEEQRGRLTGVAIVDEHQKTLASVKIYE